MPEVEPQELVEFEDASLDQELEEDEQVSEADAGNAVVYSTDWTAETLIGQLEKGNIDVKARFQRRDAWTHQYKSRFIESLILGLPVPQIVLAVQKEERGKFIVLDGKQRLLSLLQFAGKSEDQNSGFRLKALTVAKRLAGVTYADLESKPENENDLNAFQNATIRAVVIKSWPSNDYLDLVFVRLNSNSVKLSPQELRQALFPGPFTSYLDKTCAEMQPLQQVLGNAAPDFRMRDTEVGLRHLAFRLSDKKYKGNLKDFLDTFCSQGNKNWATMEAKIGEELSRLETGIAVGFKVFGKGFGKKWVGNAWEQRPNRAVLDVLLYYFVEGDIGNKALEHSDQVVKAFQGACLDPKFKESIEQTTKSITAVKTRFDVWSAALGKAIGSQLAQPGFLA